MKPEEEEIVSEEEDSEETDVLPRRRTPLSTDIAKSLVISCKLSSHNSPRVCQTIQQKGFAIPTPKQSSIYKATYRQANNWKESMKTEFKKNVYALHFDGKKVECRECQVVVLKSERK